MVRPKQTKMADERVADEDIAVQEKLKRRELKKKRKEMKKMLLEQQEQPEIKDSTGENKKKKKKDKDHEEEEDSDSSKKISEKKKKKEEKKKSNQIDAKDSENIDEGEKSKEKKKKHKKSAKKSGEMISNGENSEEIEEREGKKKKKRHSEGVKITDGENCEEIDKGEGKKKKKRHRDVEENAEWGDVEDEVKEKRKKKKQKDADSDASSSPNKSKNVRFSDDVEAFDQDNAIIGEEERDETDQFVKKSKKKRKRALYKLGFNVSEEEVVRGKRFTPGEDQLIMEAVSEYIQKQGYGMEEGLERVLNCKKHKEDSQCWKDIASALPWRPLKSVYLRAHILYQRSKERFWTEDEIKQLISLQAQHGNKWKDIANVLGKHRTHVKDTWRRVRRKRLLKGKPWTQEEYDQLFVLVNANLDLNSSDKQKGSNPMIRENLNWEAIADVMETRNPANICHKWYHNIMPKMVQTGEWEMRDDYKLLKSLLETNASHEDAVDWSMLVDNRSAETCLKRWRYMLKHLGEYSNKPFQDRLEILAGRYAPDLLL